MIAMSLHSVEPKKLGTVANLDNAEETIISIYCAQLGDQIKMIHIESTSSCFKKFNLSYF